MQIQDLVEITSTLTHPTAATYKIVGKRTAVFPIYKRNTLLVFDENLGSSEFHPIGVVLSFKNAFSKQSILEQAANPSRAYVICSVADKKRFLGPISLEILDTGIELYGEILPYTRFERFCLSFADNKYVAIRIHKLRRP